MVRMSPEDAQAKWAQRTSAATNDMAAGIARVTVAPGAAAVAKKAAWVQGVQSSVDKWARNTGRVSLDAWKAAAGGIGVQRVAQGVQAKQAKWGDFAREFFPHLDAGIQKLKNMPSNTVEDRINIAVAMMRHNHGFKRSG